MTHPEHVPVVKDMAITIPDFFRLLPRALGEEPHVAADNTVTVGTAAHGVTISIHELEPRRIARLVIARCEVTLAFVGYDQAARESFLGRFDQAYHRGGG